MERFAQRVVMNASFFANPFLQRELLPYVTARVMKGKNIADLLEMTVCVAIDACRRGAWMDLRISTLRRVLWDLNILPVDRQSTRTDIKVAAEVLWKEHVVRAERKPDYVSSVGSSYFADQRGLFIDSLYNGTDDLHTGASPLRWNTHSR